MSQSSRVTAKDLTHGTPWKVLLSFSIPLLIGNILQFMYNTVDTIVVGRFVGTNALAAVGTSNAPVMLLFALFSGVAMGATIMISQYYGAKDEKMVSKTLHTMLLLTLIIGVVITLLGLAIAKPMLHLLQVPEGEVFDHAYTYIMIFFAGITGSIFYNVLAGVLRGLGDSKTPLIFLAVSTALNIVMDLAFVVWFDNGIAGVAWATVVAQFLSALFAFIRIYRMKGMLTLSFKKLRLDRKISLQMIRLGLPSSIQQASFSIISVFIQGLINSFGPIIMASCTAVMRVDSLAMFPNFTFGMAITTYTGQNIGAGKMDRIKVGAKAALIMAVGTELILTLALLLGGRFMIGIFVDDPAVIAEGATMLRVIAAGYAFISVSHVLSGVMRGAGDTLMPMVVDVGASFLIRLPLAFLLCSLLASPMGLYWSQLAGWILGPIAMTLYYLSGKWRNKAIAGTLAQDEPPPLPEVMPEEG